MNCKNCKTNLSNDINFCPQCGARVIRNRLTPTVLIQQLNEEVISLDNKFLITLVDLFKKPEFVIDGYILGLRKRYLNVITYYAISLSLLGLQMFLLKEFAPEFLDSESMNFVPETANSESNDFMIKSQTINGYLLEYQNVLFTILMPFLAIGSWIVYLDKGKYNYTEHLVLNIYINAQWIFIGFLLYITMAIFNISDFFVASLIATPISIIYSSYVFKRVFNTTYFNALLRYLAAFMIYMITFSILMVIIVILILIYLFATGKLN